MKRKYLSIVIIGLIFAMVGVSIFSNQATEVNADSKSEKTEEKEIVTDIYVEVKGAVNSPGVYSFKTNSRVFDAIDIAGGLANDANIEYINQSRVLKDQMLIVIMTNTEIEAAIANQELVQRQSSEVVTATTQKEIIGYDSCYGAESNNLNLVSINNASRDELMTLSGIGEVKANDIVSYREANGGFESLEELMEVNGIGEATFNKIKADITL